MWHILSTKVDQRPAYGSRVDCVVAWMVAVAKQRSFDCFCCETGKLMDVWCHRHIASRFFQL